MHDRIDFDQRGSRQARDADGRSSRIRLSEVPAHRLVHVAEMSKIRQIHGYANHVVQGATRRHGHCMQIREYALDLRFDTVDQLPGRGIETDLTREVDGVCSADGLGVGADGGRSCERLYALFHRGIP